ncbi:MFS transporter [Actinacidiphila rubida]|uniref:Major Facilitator Superfamily protein n=1 Tax=Actinacidiphila rubida TaxID=310780 RepID=A0A1H8IJ59_9ACTN|nr:MFS transporter [Actinacidiphila rubida]SEN68391.1 Major Facilitator Superfamily protein [Actinacidiphila rubida]
MTTTTTATATRAARPAHRDANVLRWLAAYTASTLGDGVYFLALGFAAAKSLPPAEVGMVMAAGSVPRAALMLGGGVIADRFGPRRVVIGSDAVRCVLILAAAATLALSSPGLWLLIAVALAFGVVDALFLPAVGALPPRLAGPDQMMRLQGLRALAMRFGNIAGPPAGGLAMGLGGPSAAFATAGVLFAASVPLLVTTRIGALPRPDAADGAVDGARDGGAGAGPRSATAWQELRDGLRHLRSNRLAGPLVVSGALCELGLAGPLNVGMVLLCQERGWGSTGYGWIIAAFGVGSAGGALLLTVRGWLPRAGAVSIGTLFVSSSALGLAALAGSPTVAAAVTLFAGLVGGVCGGLTIALIQSAVHPAYLGRVSAVMSLTGFGLAPLAYPVFGAAVAAWGPTPVFLVSAGVACLGGVPSLASPTVRRAELDRPPGR